MEEGFNAEDVYLIMYIKKLAIKNSGPIEDFDVTMPFTSEHLPKPIVFVGENGTGKTMLQSCIIDFLYELGGNVFEDVRLNEGTGYKYFKISGGINRTHGKDKSFVLVTAQIDDTQIDYYDKSGKVTYEEFTAKLPEFKLNPTSSDENKKEISSLSKEATKSVREEWLKGAYFYQPAYRYEEPYWKNDAFLNEERFAQKKRFTNYLNKELEIISSVSENKTFLLDLVLDFSVDSNNLIDKITWNSVNEVIKKVLRKDSIRLGIGPRSSNRISIVKTDAANNAIESVCPSVDNLSLGEAVLLNLFVNIIRHAGNRPRPLSEITGIVLIDEVDVHLHTSLQFEVLPSLLKLFPKVQFIFTTHSPLFLLGMDNTFGNDGFEVREMPTGKQISTDRFTEFEHAYKVFEQTKKFEDGVQEKLKTLRKPVVYVEGPTDVSYLSKAFDLFGKSDILEKIDISIVGQETKTGTKSSNDVELNRLGGVLKLQPTLVNKKVMILHDPEIKVKEEDISSHIFIRKHMLHEDSEIKKGIENLFKKQLLKKAEEHKADFFSSRFNGADKVDFQVNKSEKKALCEWICSNATKEDFSNFETIIEIIESALIDKPLP